MQENYNLKKADCHVVRMRQKLSFDNISVRRFRIMAYVVISIWVLAQLCIIVPFWGEPQYSDASNYARTAYNAWINGTWYPSVDDISTKFWIANTGYINFLILNLHIFGTLSIVALEQLLLNLLYLYIIYKLIRHLSSDVCALMAVVLFCLIPSNIVAPVLFLSDLLCCVLLYGSILLVSRDNKRWAFLIAGALAVLANWVHPICIAFWPSVIIYFAIKRFRLRQWTHYIVGGALMIGLLSGITYSWCGYPIIGSTTKGTNMIIGCNDNATGAYSDRVFSPGQPGYIDPAQRFDVFQIDSALTSRSVSWIVDNPGKAVALVPSKMLYLWGGDFIGEKVLFDSTDEAPSDTYKCLSNPLTKTGLSVFYYFSLVLACCGIWYLRRFLWGKAGIIILPLLMGCAMHVLMYGGIRYHYPYLPIVLYFAGVGVCWLYGKWKKEKTSE